MVNATKVKKRIEMGCLRLNYSEKQNSRGLTLYEFDVVGMRHQTVNSGIPGMNYAGTDYFFEKNILGDVVGIYNAQTGAYVGGYSYDAWGNHLSVRDGNGNDVLTQSSHIVNLNPFRYRGYYYDTDTALYYLNTRYYDPETGRFLNPDNPALLPTTSQVHGGANLYAYCANNPIAFTDPSGEFFLALTSIIKNLSSRCSKTTESLTTGCKSFTRQNFCSPLMLT